MGRLGLEVKGYLITMRHMMLGIVSLCCALQLPQGPLPIVGSTTPPPSSGCPETSREAVPQASHKSEHPVVAVPCISTALV